MLSDPLSLYWTQDLELGEEKGVTNIVVDFKLNYNHSPSPSWGIVLFISSSRSEV